MNLLQDRLDRLPVLLPFPLLHCPDQKILRRVLHIDKLQDLHPVSHSLQHFRTKGICIKRCHPLLDNSIMEHRCKQLALHLLIHLMLTARNRQDHLRVPADRLLQRVIRRSIAGMERHDHIDLIRSLVGSDIPMKKLQRFISKFLRKTGTVLDHVRLQVQACDPYRVAL